MRRSRGYSAEALLSLLIVTALVTPACDAGAPKGPVPAGLTQQRGDTVEVVGYLDRSSEQGGDLVVYATDPQASDGAEPEVIAIVRPDGLDLDLVRRDVEGHYVWIAGRIEGGASDTETPSVISDAMEIVQEP